MFSKVRAFSVAAYNLIRYVADDWWQLAAAWSAIGALVVSGMILPLWLKQPANLNELAASITGLTAMMGIHAWRTVQLVKPNAS